VIRRVICAVFMLTAPALVGVSPAWAQTPVESTPEMKSAPSKFRSEDDGWSAVHVAEMSLA
jgi:hypothetical protein